MVDPMPAIGPAIGGVYGERARLREVYMLALIAAYARGVQTQADFDVVLPLVDTLVEWTLGAAAKS